MRQRWTLRQGNEIMLRYSWRPSDKLVEQEIQLNMLDMPVGEYTLTLCYDGRVRHVWDVSVKEIEE